IKRAAVADRRAYYFDLDRVAQAVVMPDTFSDKPTHVQQMEPVAGGERGRHIANKSLQGPPVTQHSGDDVARVDPGRASGYQLERAISRVVGQRAYDYNVAGGGNVAVRPIRHNDHLMFEVEIDRHRRDLVHADQPQVGLGPRFLSGTDVNFYGIHQQPS